MLKFQVYQHLLIAKLMYKVSVLVSNIPNSYEPLLTKEETVIIAVPPLVQSAVAVEISISKSSGGEAIIILLWTMNNHWNL